MAPNIRRAWRLWPSCKVSETRAPPSSFSSRRAAPCATCPSGRVTPSAKRCSASGPGTPSTIATYSFSTPALGCITMLAHVPSLVSNKRPSVSRSSRPTVKSRSGRCTSANTVGRPCGSCAVATTPGGLLSIRYTWRDGDGSGRPSTVITSRVGSACVPGSVTTRPLTATRPAAINRSAPRREATPASARILCTRIILHTAPPARRACARPRPTRLWSALLHPCWTMRWARCRGGPTASRRRSVARTWPR
jgi:hypothetical protein